MTVLGCYSGIITDLLGETVEFYCRYFDFQVHADHGFYVHLRHKSLSCDLGILLPNRSEVPEAMRGGQAAGTNGWLNFNVEDAASIFSRFEQSGYRTETLIVDQPWGERQFLLRDPAGTLINVAQRIDAAGP